MNGKKQKEKLKWRIHEALIHAVCEAEKIGVNYGFIVNCKGYLDNGVERQPSGYRCLKALLYATREVESRKRNTRDVEWHDLEDYFMESYFDYLHMPRFSIWTDLEALCELKWEIYKQKRKMAIVEERNI